MSKAQATEGPWRVDDDGMYIVGADGSHVCQLGDYGEIKPWREYENAKGNGPILAAAPDLLAACEMFEAACIADPVEPVMAAALNMARAAIAKAQESP